MKPCVITVDSTVLESLSDAIDDAADAIFYEHGKVLTDLERIHALTTRAQSCIKKRDGLSPGALIDITEARDIAMDSIVSAPRAGFGCFGGIAQHLGYIVDRARGS